MSIRSFFGFGKGRKSQSQSSKRALRMEALEERALLSAAPLSTSEYADLCDQYAEFNLPANMNDLNVITLDLAQGDGLSQLKSAISTAGTTTKSDLIVVRTSDTANTLTYTAAGDELLIDIDASQYGSITIVGLGTKSLTLNANQKCRGMTVGEYADAPTNANLGGLTITNGKGGVTGISGGSSYTSGGGLLVNARFVTISNCTISDNTANYGGGIDSSEYSSLTINNSEISNNTATYYLFDDNSRAQSKGGGIYNRGALTIINSNVFGNTADSGGGINSTGSLTVNDSLITGNTALFIDESGDEVGIGGGILSEGYLSAANSMITNNSAQSGGGIYCGSSFTITDSTISGNSAEMAGGVLTVGAPNASITNSSLSNNTSVMGGGFVIFAEGTLTLTNCTVSLNTASGMGGGGWNWGGNLTLINCEITDNTVTSAYNDYSGYAGGISCESYTYGDAVPKGSITIINSTISGNTVIGGLSKGGGLHLNMPANIYNSIIAGNIANNYKDILKEQDGLIINGTNTISTFTGWSTGSGNITYNASSPLFVNADKGDYRLCQNSQAVDKGANGYAGAGITTDIAGNPRFDGTIDIGAYEYQKNGTYSTVVTTLNDSFDLYDDEWSLREAISYAPLYSTTEYPTITFAEGLEGEIDLTRGQLEITTPLVIDGDNRITIDAQQKSRVFYVNAGTEEQPVVLNGLTITNGHVDNHGMDYSNNGGGVLNYGTLAITNSKILRNSAYWGGGGIYTYSTLTIANCTISENFSDNYGGGINNYNGTVTLSDSVISKNTAVAVNGGGINISSGILSVINSVIEENKSSNGGGIYINASGTCTITNSTISRNTANSAAGAINNNQGTVTITNSVISENTANSNGGGIHNHYGTITITNSTIVRNSSSLNGGGISKYYGSIKVNNTIIVGNTVNDSVNNINVLDNESNITGSNNLSSTYNPSLPLFVDADNGNYHLASGSQAINAGSNALAVDANGAALVNDLDNRSRIVYGVVDIGAYEYRASLASPTLTVSAAGSDSISVTVGEAANAAGYTVEYSTSEDFSDAVSQNVSAGVTTITGLTAETTYYFRALALGSGDYGDSAYSEIQSATTDPDTIQLASPTLSASATGSNSVSVTVGSVANASGYRVEYSTSADFANAVSQNVNAGKTTISGLTAETTYYFRALAIGSGDYGDSDFSATATATTLAEPVAADAKVNARIVFQDSLKDADTAAELPEGITSIRATKTVYAEIWVKDVEDTDPAIVGGYVNMLYDSEALTVENVTYGTVFTQFNNIQNASVPGVIDLIGGGVTQGVKDKGDDEWIRLATVSFVVNTDCVTTVSLTAPTDYHDNVTLLGGVILTNDQIDFGSAVLEITAACPMDIDGDGYIGMSDYALMSAAWRSSPGKDNWNSSCDIDGDGYVGFSDYAFLSSNWRKYTTDPDLVYPRSSASSAALVSDAVVGVLEQSVLEPEPAVVSMAAAVVSEENSGDLTNPIALEADETAKVCLTAVSSKTASDVVADVPASLTEINPGDSFFVEIWVRNINGYQGSTLCGLLGGYLNMGYPSDLLTVGDVTYGSVFTLFNNYQNASVPGVIDLIGGAVAQGVKDKGDDEWVRLATVAFTASEKGDALVESLPPTDSHDNLTLTSGKTLKNDDIDFGSLTLSIGSIVIQLMVQNDFVKTTLNNSVVIAYRENDAVADWSKTTVEFGDASNGEYSVNGNGTITYTPEDGFYGTDAVSYVVVDSTGELSTGAIVISVGLPIATSVQKTSGSHSPSSAMAASVERLTDWDNCCVELWAQDVNALNPGETTFTLSYNPTIYNAPYFSACADGVALSVTDSAALPDGSVEVQLTARVLESLSSQTDNLFLGTVVLTPSMDDGAGVVAPLAAEPVCALDGSETPTTVEAMPYDLIRNGSVDVNDFVAFATVFGYVPGNMSPVNPLYVQTAKSDFNKDGSVNADDFVLFAINFGATKNTADKPAPLASAATELVRSEVFENAELIESQPELKSSLTLRDAYSAALLDLYDNQDVADLSGSSDVLAESRMNAQLFDVESDSSHKASSQAIDAVLEEDLLAIDWN